MPGLCQTKQKTRAERGFSRLPRRGPGSRPRWHRGWRVGSKGRFAWERPLRKTDLAALGDAAPDGPVLALHTRDLAGKDAHLEELPHLCFTVPHFDKFMKRAIPDLEVPPVRRR